MYKFHNSYDVNIWLSIFGYQGVEIANNIDDSIKICSLNNCRGLNDRFQDVHWDKKLENMVRSEWGSGMKPL